MIRFSTLFAAIALLLLFSTPWVELSAQWTIYWIAVASAVAAAMFRLTND